MFYLKGGLPLVERFLLKGTRDFAMFGTYCTNFGEASDFAEMLAREGLEVEFTRYFFGCATGVVGRKAGWVGSRRDDVGEADFRF